ncbi:MAG: DUF1364 family protein [Sideroxydans sp.]|nr:DUF1364 family protein [Sideroxydans sp.]
MSLLKSKRHESKKIREAARGRECQVRLPGICNHNNDTVVFAHVRLNTGAGRKESDLFGAFACDACHSEVDRRTRHIASLDVVKAAFYEGVFRTQQILLDEELVTLA